MTDCASGEQESRKRGNCAVAVACAAAIGLTAVATPASAQQRIGFIRDAEIEELVRDYSMPLFKAAAVGASSVRIYIVSSREFNAFVADGRRMFINAGTIMGADTPNEVIGVVAHETGHIAGGHLARFRLQLQNAQAIMVLSALLGAAAAVGAAAAGSAEGARAGQALVLGGQQLAMRTLLAYRRSEEQAADRAAINYLNATRQSAKGMIKTFEGFADQMLFAAKFADPYALSHPMPRERIGALQRLASSSRYYEQKDSAELQLRHDLARAKLHGFMEHPNAVGRRYKRSDKNLPAQYARSIALMRRGSHRKALKALEKLIKQQPRNAYFHELKGDMLIRAGKPEQALAPLRQAIALKPNAPLIRITYGHALVATENRSYLNEAVKQLRQALQVEPEHSGGYIHLATAYGRLGNIGQAELASAYRYFTQGDLKLAKRFAGRAKQNLPKGSPAWLQADDVLNVRPPRS